MKKPLYGDWKSILAKDCLQIGEVIDEETMFYFRENAGETVSEQSDCIIQMSEVADIIGGKPLYNTISKEHQYAPWRYAGQCLIGETINQNPALMPMIYVCSRYRADNREELQRNIEIAKWVCFMISKDGAIPIAPHLYFTQFMNDNLPDEKYFGMGSGKRLMEHCTSFHVVTVDDIISEGMAEEIKYMTDTLHLEGTTTKLTNQDAEQIMASRLER